ncbi:DNA-binding protein P3A2 isoform X1 [Hydra vulgaris]|uniref:DNA-binding protein P3A2 isoform X1 n=1 Tax=Hydra vulgaris TaxID=6087 RepID=UPI001F5FC34D|nr:DNA-binding protein P3A2 isoform X1 [Hydra vulgaris]XP_047146405.1 DNA-binding protein P3A2 isoform X1 [Hydra vulgaris]
MDQRIHQHTTVKLEDMTHVQVHGNIQRSNSLSMGHHHVGSMSDDMSDEPSSPESASFDDSDLLTTTTIGVVSDDIGDDVTAQLAAAGPIGMAAAAAIITGKRRKKHFSFETNPSIRKRQATRLLRKLKQLMTEYTTRVGQQACIVVCSPAVMFVGKMGASFKCFGAAPLETIIRNRRNLILEDLENSLAQQAPSIQHHNPDLHELPPLVIEGIPTPVDKMTQAQLRAFIPIMLKYSTGRGKPGWGRDNTKPPWWPAEVPWANVRSDVRSDEEKKEISWTNALRRVVQNCYTYHGREELLDAFSTQDSSINQHQQSTQVFTSQYPHLVHTINNADGTVSIIQVDASGAVTTLSENATHSEATEAVATLAEVAASQGQSDGMYGSHNIDHARIDQRSINTSALQDGQIILGRCTNLIPVTLSANGGVQFITTSSLSSFRLTQHPRQLRNSDDSTTLSIDIPMHSVSDHVVSGTNVPKATQTVDVVTLSDRIDI